MPSRATPRALRPSADERRAVVLLSLVAAVPSLAAGLLGGGFLTDDWGMWLVLDGKGVVDGMWHVAFEQPARPLTAPYYALVYLGIGDSPVVQSVIIGAINALVVVAAWACGRRFLPSTVLLPVLAFVALAPNHAMTRMWFQVGPYALALAIALFAVRELDRRHPIAAGALLVAATLMYEGVVVLALSLAAIWAAREWTTLARWRTAVLVALPAVVAAAGSYLLSPKRRGSGPVPFDNASSFFAGQLGTGLWDIPLVAQVVGGLLLASLLAAAVVQLPSWRRPDRELRLALVGAALAVVSAAPYFVSGSTFATTGVFDRNNLVPGIGVAVTLGALWSFLWSRSRPAASTLGVAVVVWFAAMQVQDVVNFADAVERGDRIVERLAAAPGVDDSGTILVVPAQESNGTGLADFIYDGDLTGAMRYRHGGDWSRIHLVENGDCSRFAESQDEVTIQVFDWRSGDVERVPVSRVEPVCEAARERGA